MISLGAVTLVCLTFICSVMFYVAVKRSRHNIEVCDRNRLQKITEKKPSHFIDKGQLDTKCEICFGDIGNEIIRVCDCGRTFHIDCVEATEECPYCKRKKDAMTERNAKRTVCPVCGRVVEKNICDCGVVIPYGDGTYSCKCGETVSVYSDGCSKCGSSLRTEIGR